MAALYLGAISLLLAVVHTLCELRVDQAPFASGIVGSTVNLPCRLIDAKKQVDRVHPYWISQKPNQSEVTLFPVKPGEEIRVQLKNKEDWKDMSISVSNLQLSDTSKYICRISVLKETEHLYLAGNGTMLYVHGSIQMDFSSSHGMCKALVQTAETVSLVWNFTFGDKLRGEELSSKQQNPDGSFWIVSHAPIQPQCTANGNVMWSCSLKNNKGYVIDTQRVAFPCLAPIEMDFNNTHVTCVSQVQEAQNISFVWDFGRWKLVHGPELIEQWHKPDGSYWINSSVTFHQEKCTPEGNVRISCLLRNSLGCSFQNRSIEVPCTGGSKSKGHHPGLFFFLLLGSTLLILLVVLLLFYRRRHSRNSRQRLKVNAARPIPTEIYVPWIPICSLNGGHVGK